MNALEFLIYFKLYKKVKITNNLSIWEDFEQFFDQFYDEILKF